MKKVGYIFILLVLVLFISWCWLSEEEKAAKENIYLANQEIKLGDYNSAILYLDRAIELDSKNALAYYMRWGMYFLWNQIDAWCEDLLKASHLTYGEVPKIEKLLFEHCFQWLSNKYMIK